MPRDPASNLINPPPNNINKLGVSFAIKRSMEFEEFNLPQKEFKAKRQKIGFTEKVDEDFRGSIIENENHHQVHNQSSSPANSTTESSLHVEPNRQRRIVDDQIPAFQEAINILRHQPNKQKD